MDSDFRKDSANTEFNKSDSVLSTSITELKDLAFSEQYSKNENANLAYRCEEITYSWYKNNSRVVKSGIKNAMQKGIDEYSFVAVFNVSNKSESLQTFEQQSPNYKFFAMLRYGVLYGSDIFDPRWANGVGLYQQKMYCILNARRHLSKLIKGSKVEVNELSKYSVDIKFSW